MKPLNDYKFYSEFVSDVLTDKQTLPSSGQLSRGLKQFHAGILKRDYALLSGYYLAELCARLILGFTLLLLSYQQNWLVFSLALFFQSLNLLAAVSVAHDCAHRSFSQSNWINSTVGLVFGALVFVRFFRFKTSHLEHHKFNQSLQDPKRKPLVSSGHESKSVKKKNKLDGVLSFVFESLYQPAPVFVKNIMILLVFIPMALPVILFNYEFGPFKAVTTKKDALEIGVIGAIWASLIYFLGWQTAFFVAILPVFTAAPLITSVFMTHAAKWTLFAKTMGKKDFVLMNFNIANLSLGKSLDRLGYSFNLHHVEHHMFPAIPFFKLKYAKDFLEQNYADYIFPTQTFNMRYMRHHVLGALANCEPREFNGRVFKVSAGFDSVMMPALQRREMKQASLRSVNFFRPFSKA